MINRFNHSPYSMQNKTMQINLVSLCLPDSFWTNPQYRVKINSENSEKSGEKNMLLSLMQKPDKRNRRLVQNLHIGFSVFEVNITLHCICHSVWTITYMSCRKVADDQVKTTMKWLETTVLRPATCYLKWRNMIFSVPVICYGKLKAGRQALMSASTGLYVCSFNSFVQIYHIFCTWTTTK